MGSTYIRQLMEERDKITLEAFTTGKPDFTALRELSRHFEEIDSDGSDSELWLSAQKYLRELDKQAFGGSR